VQGRTVEEHHRSAAKPQQPRAVRLLPSSSRFIEHMANPLIDLPEENDVLAIPVVPHRPRLSATATS